MRSSCLIRSTALAGNSSSWKSLGMGARAVGIASRVVSTARVPHSTTFVVVAGLHGRFADVDADRVPSHPAGTSFNDFLAYPPMAVLASLLFMMLGSSYWGYCYISAAVFLVLAILMTLLAKRRSAPVRGRLGRQPVDS